MALAMETRSREGARGKYVSANYAEKGPVKMADAALAFPLGINNSDLDRARDGRLTLSVSHQKNCL